MPALVLLFDGPTVTVVVPLFPGWVRATNRQTAGEQGLGLRWSSKLTVGAFGSDPATDPAFGRRTSTSEATCYEHLAPPFISDSR